MSCSTHATLLTLAGMLLRLQFIEFLADGVLSRHRWVGDAEPVQRVLCRLSGDGEYGVDDSNVIGHLAQLLYRDAFHQFVGGRDGFLAECLVLRDAVVERQPVVLLFVQEIHVADELLPLFKEFF